MSPRDADDHEDPVSALRSALEEVQAELAEQRAEAVTLRSAHEASTAELQAVYRSFSWRWTRLPRLAWRFVVGLPPFLREMRDFPRRARFTWKTRGARALFADIEDELASRLRHGTLAARERPLAAHPATALPLAARGGRAARGLLRLPRVSDPRASIVIPVFNQFDRTYLCIASIVERSGDLPYELIVVDDASSDETREIERVVTGARVVRQESNRGFIDACNRGAEHARGEFVVFLNNDTLVSRDWLVSLLEPFEEPDVGIVGAKLLFPDGRLQESGGIVFADGSGWNFGRGDDPGNPKYEFRCDAHYCSGACLAIRRELFEEVGGFDARFAPMYYEDVDLAFAVRASGLRVVYQPACVIVHAEGGTAGVDVGTGAKRYQIRNRQKFVEKWKDALGELPPPGAHPDSARLSTLGRHVLVIDSYTPRPDSDAGSLRMLNILRILRRLGCHVTFVPDNRAHDGEYTRALQAAGVETLYHPYLPSLKEHLKQAGTRYHAVIMSRVDVARQAVDTVRRHCPRARRVFDTVDLHFLRETRRAGLSGGRRSARTERSKAQEIAVARACDVTLVVSPAEKEVLAREAPDLVVEVLSLIQPPQPTETSFADRSGIVFIGNFLHPPNCDAVEHYLRDVHPAVRERLPQVKLTVIGPNPPGSFETFEQDGIRFVGHVPDIRPYFAAARLSIAPLRYGAGIKGKILTSLAFGVPVVTTTIGAEGTNLEDGEHLLIADASPAFVDAVVALHTDAALWARLAENGLRSVTSQFSFEQAESALARVLALPVRSGADRAPRT